MQYINGKKLSDNLEKLDSKKICIKIGEILTKLHNADIIHGDLTTSNMIYVENADISNPKTNKTTLNQLLPNKTKDNSYINKKIKIFKNKDNNNSKIYLIDFGLSFHSHKIEDKAVDLHLLKQALEAKHFKIAKECFNNIIKNYKPEQYRIIKERIPIIESRGRYKKK